MESSLSHGYTAPGGTKPDMQLPGHVDGFVDVDILVDIHTSLIESEKSDDTSLAQWIKINYLQDPLIETGRRVRDAEGYANIDKAYRRVRQLTGKAKDKWPFFDINWKKMGSTVVKNAILGIAAAGAFHSDGSGELRDMSMSNGFGDQPDHDLETLRLQRPSSEANNAGYQTRAQKLQQSPNRASARQRTARQTANRQGLLFRDFSLSLSQSPTESDSDLEITSLDKREDTPALDSKPKDTMPSVDALRDAGAGKVRGPHGRFVNKDKPSPPAANKSSTTKLVRTTRTKAAPGIEIEEDGISSSKGIMVSETRHEVTSISSEGKGEGIRHDSESSTGALSAEAVSSDSASHLPVSAVLAAEAEAVPSNLDRLPPGLMHKKRKSESNIERVDIKRARGSRGGVLGRPCKHTTLAEQSPPVSEKSIEVEQLSMQSEIPIQPETPVQPETPAKTRTRQKYRKSAASARESSIPWDPAADVLLNGIGHNQPHRHKDGATLRNSDAVSLADQSSKGAFTSLDSEAKDVNEEFANGAPYTTPKDTPPSQSSKTEKASASGKKKKRVSFSPEVQTNDVQIFARITTSAGTQDVPLLEVDIGSEVNLVKRYAAWQNAGNIDATFEVFKNIVQFTR
ncbi:hypothetical protein OPT61_g3254 [Boeremia exigua]|uniref:Uncharacterized protein n=1 Tax=Boeremia exigua TaxID=749465 RepID=A0ACC2IIK4_9PLEO|nr:hypothetical protein OPT61_g3254 [Boeremia exigua]